MNELLLYTALKLVPVISYYDQNIYHSSRCIFSLFCDDHVPISDIKLVFEQV